MKLNHQPMASQHCQIMEVMEVFNIWMEISVLNNPGNGHCKIFKWEINSEKEPLVTYISPERNTLDLCAS